MSHILDEVDWIGELSDLDAASAYDYFTGRVLAVLEEFVPMASDPPPEGRCLATGTCQIA